MLNSFVHSEIVIIATQQNMRICALSCVPLYLSQFVYHLFCVIYFLYFFLFIYWDLFVLVCAKIFKCLTKYTLQTLLFGP